MTTANVFPQQGKFGACLIAVMLAEHDQHERCPEYCYQRADNQQRVFLPTINQNLANDEGECAKLVNDELWQRQARFCQCGIGVMHHAKKNGGDKAQ